LGRPDAQTGIRVIRQTPAVRALFLATIAFTLCGSFMAALYMLFALRDSASRPPSSASPSAAAASAP
jgi:hypothetical protein